MLPEGQIGEKIRSFWREGKKSSVLSKIVNSLYKSLDNKINEINKIPTTEDVACREGCNHCCYVNVDLDPSELFYLKKQMQKNFTTQEKQKIKLNLEKIVTEIDKINENNQSRFDAHIPCGLMTDSGSCSIYEFRPISCRKHFSLDASLCKKDGSFIIQDGFIIAGKSHQDGLSEGNLYSELEQGPIELNSGLLMVLNDSTLEKKWLKGKNIFSDLKSKYASLNL